MATSLNNWAGNYTYTAPRLHYPETIEQVQEIVSRSEKLRVLGSRHSFNDIADTPGDLVSVDRMAASGDLLALDRERHTATIGAAARYGQINRRLHSEGYALHNLASLPHISVAGACATATHGSGDRNGNLATAVSALELVTAGGSVVTLPRERDGDEFAGVVVGLGGLGVVTKLTLDVVPAFDMRQDAYENLAIAQAVEHFEEIVSAADSVSLFTRWRDGLVDHLWFKRRVTDDDDFTPAPELFGATLAQAHRHPIPGLSAESCTEQMGIRGPWFERLPHFRLDFTPSSGEELQSEYLVPRQHAVNAISAINDLSDRVAPLLQVSEIRTIAADDLWMSPCYRQPCVGIHFTWRKDWEEVRQLLPVIEEALSPFDARPHWGKLFTMSPERVRSLYPKLPDFQRLLRSYDPQSKFRNRFLDMYIFGED
ncbi:MAG: alditol oxidase [Chloroflexia bacterium]|jgi:xylitol oxidase|nr:alditol oxidase [Chloroflexia bacterium]